MIFLVRPECDFLDLSSAALEDARLSVSPSDFSDCPPYSHEVCFTYLATFSIPRLAVHKRTLQVRVWPSTTRDFRECVYRDTRLAVENFIAGLLDASRDSIHVVFCPASSDPLFE